jgi:predicted permease
MSFLRALLFRLRSRFSREELASDFAEELRVHREFLEAEARRAGATDDDARRAAALRLGNETAIRERTRDAWSLGWIEPALQDLRYAVRFLRRSPAFTAVAVISLALGIGANAAVFSVVDRLLLSPPPHVSDAGELYQIIIRRETQGRPDVLTTATMTFPEIFALKESSRSFASIVPYQPPSRKRLGRGPEAPRLKESMVAGDFFSVLGTRPIRGRFFLPDDDRAGVTERAAVISHGFWQRHFAGADSAVGARLSLAGMEVVVVGVAPAGFTGIEMDASDVWVPLGAGAPFRLNAAWKSWTGFANRAVVRLNAGVTPEAAAAEANLILARMPQRPDRAPTKLTAQLGPVLAGLGPADKPADVAISSRLLIASALVLLAACANLANLLLVRALSRRREIALRLAVGISRGRLVAQMAMEALLLAGAGAVGALVAAQWGGAALRTLVFPQMQWATAPVDFRVFLFSVACGVAVALVATIAPAIRMTRADVATALRSAAPQLTMSTGRLRQGLIVLQVALSVLLVVGATAFGRSLQHAYDFDMGVDVNRVIVARIYLETDSLTPVGRLAMMEEATRRARLLPGVERASLAHHVPLSGNMVTRAWVSGRTDTTFAVNWNVTAELIPTVGFRLVQGRSLMADDERAGAPPVALVTETMARKLWPGTNAIGNCVRFGADTAPCAEVVGVVGDLRTRSIREQAPMAALRYGGAPGAEPGEYIVVRTSGPPEQVVPILRTAFRDLRTDLATLDIRMLAESLDYEYRPLRIGAAMFGSFALLAVILSAVGLYGILAFSVAQRTGEFGIRTALGARAADIVRNVMREGLGVVAIGVVAGGAVSWYASTAVEKLLFESSGRAGTPYLVAALALGVVAIIASAIPAWRATRVDPVIALRAE